MDTYRGTPFTFRDRLAFAIGIDFEVQAEHGRLQYLDGASHADVLRRCLERGEVIVTEAGITNTWVDARTIVRTDDTYRSARIDWDTSERRASGLLAEVVDSPKRIVTQGFIGFSIEGDTTTLGREGSDFSAAIFAYLLDAESVTIWKDVPGMFNADPKLFPDTAPFTHQLPRSDRAKLFRCQRHPPAHAAAPAEEAHSALCALLRGPGSRR